MDWFLLFKLSTFVRGSSSIWSWDLFPRSICRSSCCTWVHFLKGFREDGPPRGRIPLAAGISFRPLMFDALSLYPFTLNLRWLSARILQKALLSGYRTELCRRNCHFAAFRRRRMPATSYVQMDMVAQLHSLKDRYLVQLDLRWMTGW